jgi:MFS transporter, DHA3 family, macrolide efflux protein
LRVRGEPWAIHTTNLTSTHNVAKEAVSVVIRRPLLLTRDFGLIWLSQLVSQVGDGISNLALLWFVYSITGSPVKTTIIGLIHTIPPIVLGPFIGVYVDRLPKKFFLVGSNVFRALLMGIIPCAISTDTFTVNLLYVLVFMMRWRWRCSLRR